MFFWNLKDDQTGDLAGEFPHTLCVEIKILTLHSNSVIHGEPNLFSEHELDPPPQK